MPSDKLAKSLLGILSYAGAIDSPPELLDGLIKADAATLEHEFDLFCEKIPELAENQDKQMELKLALINLLVQQHLEHIQAEEDMQGEDEGQNSQATSTDEAN